MEGFFPQKKQKLWSCSFCLKLWKIKWWKIIILVKLPGTLSMLTLLKSSWDQGDQDNAACKQTTNNWPWFVLNHLARTFEIIKIYFSLKCYMTKPCNGLAPSSGCPPNCTPRFQAPPQPYVQYNKWYGKWLDGWILYDYAIYLEMCMEICSLFFYLISLTVAITEP